jgi:hypothetical protein
MTSAVKNINMLDAIKLTLEAGLVEVSFGGFSWLILLWQLLLLPQRGWLRV